MTGTLQGQVQAPQARSYLYLVLLGTKYGTTSASTSSSTASLKSGQSNLTVSLLDYDTVRALLDLQYATYHLPPG